MASTTGVTTSFLVGVVLILVVSRPVPGSAAGSSATSSHSEPQGMTTFRLPPPAATSALLLEDDLSLLDLGSCKTNCRE